MVGQWEANTMRKPHEVAKALDRHPDKVVIFIDVYCVVHGALDALAGIRGDVAFYVRTKYRRNGGMRFGTRSGTLVFRPTDMARAFVANWIAAAKGPPGSRAPHREPGAPSPETGMSRDRIHHRG